MNYGEKLNEIRTLKNIKQNSVAQYLGISAFTYSHYETQDSIIPSKHLNSVCNYFNVSIDYLFSFTNTKQYRNVHKEIDKIKAGKRLKEIRNDIGIIQEELAKILNTSKSVVADYERGRYLISTPFLYTICTKYKVSADYLLGRIDKKITFKK